MTDTDLKDLLFAFWRECVFEKEVRPFAINYDLYVRLYHKGLLQIVSARANGRLVGIATYFISPTPHHGPKFIQAINDVFYIRRGFRRGITAVRMLHAAFKQLRENTAAHVVYHASPQYRRIDELFRAVGMIPKEMIFRKTLR